MYKVAFFCVALSAVNLTIGFGESPNLNPDVMREVERLVARSSDEDDADRGGDLVAQQGADKANQVMEEAKKIELQRLNDIAHRPGITPYLFALLEKHYSSEPSDKVSSILRAIATRSDLTKDQVASIEEELRRLLTNPYDAKDYMANDFLRSGVAILTADPSKESERIAIAVLERSDDFSWLMASRPAIMTLSAIGSDEAERALTRATVLLSSHDKAGVSPIVLRQLALLKSASDQIHRRAPNGDNSNTLRHLDGTNPAVGPGTANPTVQASTTGAEPSMIVTACVILVCVTAAFGIRLTARRKRQ